MLMEYSKQFHSSNYFAVEVILEYFVNIILLIYSTNACFV